MLLQGFGQIEWDFTFHTCPVFSAAAGRRCGRRRGGSSAPLQSLARAASRVSGRSRVVCAVRGSRGGEERCRCAVGRPAERSLGQEWETMVRWSVGLTWLVVCLLLLCRSPAAVSAKECGRRRGDLRSQRIVGGSRSWRGEWPWQVSLHQRNPHTGQLLNQHCGGTLIDPGWVLTAAHCIVDPLFGFTIPPVFWIVKMGHIELNDKTPPMLAGVSKIITHKYFDTKTWNHDIALVKLKEPLELDELSGINTVCLPTATSSYEGHLCHVTGWGKVGENGSDSEVLQKIAVPVIPYNDCYKKYESINPITPGMVCAGGDQPNKGPCVGDSGGPLQCRRQDGAWVQIGVTSWGVGCARQNYPSVYVNIADYINWIYFHLAKDYLAALQEKRRARDDVR